MELTQKQPLHQPLESARQWLSPTAISITQVDCSSSINLGLADVASTEPVPRHGPQPQANTCEHEFRKHTDALLL